MPFINIKFFSFCKKKKILYGEKKYLDESKKQRQELTDIEACIINQVLIY
jgi:hypothetical protein